MVDKEMELEAEEPTHVAATTLGQTWEDLVAADAGIVADRQLGATGKVDSGCLAAKIMQE